jgi:hypothetical protein
LLEYHRVRLRKDRSIAHRSGAQHGPRRGLDVPLADRFKGLYVNDLTFDYGYSGRAAEATVRISKLTP